ncbi:hypothetical protein AMECASPLE_028883 [Ameca splendens]|uniref:Secreted protein n=1 Tax=Ameca splendens TaxID=208324 RepID=A0ABV0YSW1_9TELE
MYSTLLTGLYGGAVGSTVALQQEGPGFDSWPFSLCMRGFSPGTLASSHRMVVCVLPCDGLVTLPPAHRLLERSSLLVQRSVKSTSLECEQLWFQLHLKARGDSRTPENFSTDGERWR